MQKNNTKVIVGMSGGVDSSAVAAMLVNEGYDVTGVTMKIWDGSIDIKESGDHACYGPEEHEDLEDAQAVCHKLGIELKIFDLSKEYNKNILEYFKEEYLKGRTPNPCVKCNTEMKFGLLLDQVEKSGIEYDYFATGHYAQIAEVNGKKVLKKAVDNRKDQTYFIYRLEEKQLNKCMFPLGKLTKPEVRELSKKYNLLVSEKDESQNFISGGYNCLFEGCSCQGNIINTEGKILGKHQGIHNFTVGQRKGLKIASTEPYYVVEIDSESQTVIVGRKDELLRTGLIAKDIHLTLEIDPEKIYTSKIRYATSDKECKITISNNELRAKFTEPQSAITPGQSIVIYDGDLVVGGGIIDKALN